MMPLLVFRERVKNFYQRSDIYLVPIIKFIFAFIAFQAINSEIGYDGRLKSFLVVFIMSLLSTFTPPAIMVLLAAAAATLHVYFVSPILSILIVVILLVLYLLFARYTPRLGYVILAIPILYILKIPYMIPILLGIISTPIAIIPMSCGVILYFVFQVIKTAVTMQVNMTVEDILLVYTYVIDNLVGNKQMIMTIVIFSLMLIVTYFVRRMRFDYAFEISVAAGALTGLLGFLVSYLILGKSSQIFSMILGIIASGVIVFFVNFFKLTLDYSGVEHVQFEDDVYYYYVKAVPKVTVTTPQRNVKHINVKDFSSQSLRSDWNDDTDADDYDEDEDTYQEDHHDYTYHRRPIDRNRNDDR
ncbi:MAG: hypothetical protein E7255_11740 [Lachnospiraceae bacterium]|nr:hypothetical protein [Lachnospiraceae bacterium]